MGNPISIEVTDNTKLLIDGDIVAYKIAFSCQKKIQGVFDKETQEPIAFLRGKMALYDWASWFVGGDEDQYKEDDLEIRESLESDPVYKIHLRFNEFIFNLWSDVFGDQPFDRDRILFCLSHDDIFRKQKYPDYKSNRTGEKPKELQFVIDLMKDYNYSCIKGLEADDLLGIYGYGTTDVIASTDKDLLMIPGIHYNFGRKEWNLINDKDGWFNFCKQLLTGDSVDNIIGIKGVGEVRAKRMLEGCSSKKEMFRLIKEKYIEHNRLEDFYKNCELLWIWRVDKSGRYYKKVD